MNKRIMKQDNDKDSRHLHYFKRLDDPSEFYESIVFKSTSDEDYFIQPMNSSSPRSAVHLVPIEVVPDDDVPFDAMTI